MKEKFLCIIPARGGSKGIPNKNIIDFMGKPLISYALTAATKSGIFDKIIVSTDSTEIATIAKEYGGETPFIRPYSLSTDEALVEDAIFHALEYLRSNGDVYDYVCLMQATSPLVAYFDLIWAKNLLEVVNADMIVSVSNSPIRLDLINYVKDDLSMENFASSHNKNRQSTKNACFLNGAIYLGKWDIFYNKLNYYGKNTYAFFMPYERSIDIDNHFDLRLAQFFMEYYKDKK